jgi:hypothetical protein
MRPTLRLSGLDTKLILFTAKTLLENLPDALFRQWFVEECEGGL